MKKDLFESTEELAAFITRTLPNMKDTGLAKHLRKIKPDPVSKGKGIIIWYGDTSIMSVTELRVTVNLGVKSITEPMWDEIAPAVEKTLKDAYAKSKKRKTKKITGEVKQVTIPVETPVETVVKPEPVAAVA